MKKILALLISIICIISLAACSGQGKTEDNTAETVSVEGADAYKIGVIVYNNTDEEVIAFQRYLEDYIAKVFPGISFLYSDSITTEEEELAFIRDACEQGADGFLSFLSQDLKQEVELCSKYKAYYILASGTVSDEAFHAVADNPYFIGEVGPGTEMEYDTGADMAEYFYKKQYGNEYFILSGGSGMGNEMHLQRTRGILDKLQELYGVNLEQTSEEIAMSATPVHMSAGELTVCVTPGYISRDEFLKTASQEYEKDQFDIVLSVLPIADMADLVKESHLGLVDSYNERNLQLFNKKQLNYVAGKYSSIIGPSFAAMYNAVTGYAEDFRDNGKAFRLTQGFWYSSEPDDFVEKYSLANSVVTNAYNYEDLGKVCKVYNPEATLEDLKELTAAYSFEDALQRRGESEN